MDLPVAACYDCDNPGLPMEHGLYVIRNVKPKEHNDDYAIGTTPPGFSVRLSTLPDAGIGVFAETDIPANTRIGPYEGVIYKQSTMDDMSYVWTVDYADESEVDVDEDHHYVDGKPKTHASWLRYVNMANTIDQENLYIYQYNFEIYYVTYECVKAGTELLVWYGDEYGENFGLTRTDEDYQTRFNTSGKQFIEYLNTIPNGPVVRYSFGCYKYSQQCPYVKLLNRTDNVAITCFYGSEYDVCKYVTCDINPCTGLADCRKCRGYCYYMGRYFRPHEEFEHIDNINVCVCNEDLEITCSEEPSSHRDMCFY